MAKHITTVAYANVQVAGAELAGWRVEQQDDGRYRVWGPCPVCRGAAWGPPHYSADDGESAQRLTESDRGETLGTRTVPASCACGHGHGEDGASSCGRRWYVEVVEK